MIILSQSANASLRLPRQASGLPPKVPSVANLERLALVSSGALAEVWLAEDHATGKLHALKQLRDDSPSPNVAKQLLANEAEVGEKVESEHVVRTGAYFPDAEPPCLLLEWLSGETLETRLGRVRSLPVDETLWIARQCVQGLHDLLRSGFTHGDIKPSNVFLCRSGLVKLIDLGFARPDERCDDELDRPERVIAGTPEYLAPESITAEPACGVARDLYALGITIYRMLTGRLPFSGETVAEILRQQQQAHPARLRVLAPHAPKEVEALVERLLAKQPIRRGQGLGDLLHEIVGLELHSIAVD